MTKLDLIKDMEREIEKASNSLRILSSQAVSETFRETHAGCIKEAEGDLSLLQGELKRLKNSKF